MPRNFYIETLGCQMNVLDSELAAASLIGAGYLLVAERSAADIVIFNTCSVRQHAEDKVYSALGRLKHFKRDKSDGIIIVMGCMAQKDKGTIFKRAPHVDIVVGPGQLERLPELVKSLDNKSDNTSSQLQPRTALLEISLDRITNKQPDVRESFHQYDPQRLAVARHNSFQAMVRVMFGCDKFCSYCIVPSVRGPEQCRPPKEIVDEVKSLVGQGVIEVTLIGQTVNSYKYNDGGTTFELADILAAIHDIDGLQRIRFLTNYPRGMSNRLLEAVRDLTRIAPFLHVPAQSGADSVLQRMKRQYTVTEYRELLGRINEIVPDAAVTSDFIVGFCGETDDEFAKTVELVRDGRFKNSYIFKYSERTGTKAAELPDDVPDETKRRRNNDLLAVQNKISLELNETFVGKTVEVLVDGIGDKPNQLTSRTACDRIVMFDGNETLVGQFRKVKIQHAAPFTLFGELE